MRARRRLECAGVMRLMRDTTGTRTRVREPGTVGCHRRAYRDANGHVGIGMVVGSALHGRALAHAVMPELGLHARWLAGLGCGRRGVPGLDLESPAESDLAVWRRLLACAAATLRRTHPCA